MMCIMLWLCVECGILHNVFHVNKRIQLWVWFADHVILFNFEVTDCVYVSMKDLQTANILTKDVLLDGLALYHSITDGTQHAS